MSQNRLSTPSRELKAYFEELEQLTEDLKTDSPSQRNLKLFARGWGQYLASIEENEIKDINSMKGIVEALINFIKEPDQSKFKLFEKRVDSYGEFSSFQSMHILLMNLFRELKKQWNEQQSWQALLHINRDDLDEAIKFFRFIRNQLDLQSKEEKEEEIKRSDTNIDTLLTADTKDMDTLTYINHVDSIASTIEKMLRDTGEGTTIGIVILKVDLSRDLEKSEQVEYKFIEAYNAEMQLAHNALKKLFTDHSGRAGSTKMFVPTREYTLFKIEEFLKTKFNTELVEEFSLLYSQYAVDENTIKLFHAIGNSSVYLTDKNFEQLLHTIIAILNALNNVQSQDKVFGQVLNTYFAIFFTEFIDFMKAGVDVNDYINVLNNFSEALHNEEKLSIFSEHSFPDKVKENARNLSYIMGRKHEKDKVLDQMKIQFTQSDKKILDKLLIEFSDSYDNAIQLMKEANEGSSIYSAMGGLWQVAFSVKKDINEIEGARFVLAQEQLYRASQINYGKDADPALIQTLKSSAQVLHEESKKVHEKIEKDDLPQLTELMYATKACVQKPSRGNLIKYYDCLDAAESTSIGNVPWKKTKMFACAAGFGLVMTGAAFLILSAFSLGPSMGATAPLAIAGFKIGWDMIMLGVGLLLFASAGLALTRKNAFFKKGETFGEDVSDTLRSKPRKNSH